MREQVNELFDPSGIVSQRRIRQRLLSAIESFLNGNGVSSAIDGPSLSRRFQESKLPSKPSSPEGYAASLVENLVEHSINTSSPRCLAHMSGPALSPLRPLGELILALNQNLVKREASKAATLLERQTLGMLHRLVYSLDEDFYSQHIHRNGSVLGIMASGGSIANTTALWCARNACFPPSDGFEGVEKEGLPRALERFGFRGGVILGSDLMHYSIDKAADILGMGAKSVLKVPVDSSGALVPAELEAAVKRCKMRSERVIAIVGTAGTTDYGSLDPLAEMAEIAEAAGAHLHVDAAWGGPLLFCQERRAAIAGIERADSVTIDGHKQLFLPVGASMLLLKDPQAVRVLEKQANYMLRKDSGDLGGYSLEGSRPALAILIHATLHLLGREGLETVFVENVEKARAMARRIEGMSDFELLVEPQTNIVLYRYVPTGWKRADGTVPADANGRLNALNEAIQTEQFDAGRTLTSRTTLSSLPAYPGTPIVALRAILGNPRTTEEDISAVLEDQAEIALRLLTAQLGAMP